MTGRGTVGISWVSETAKPPTIHGATSRNKELSSFVSIDPRLETLFLSQVGFLLLVFSAIKAVKIVQKFLVLLPRAITVSSLFFILLIV